jgi:regulator of extracellular matrix RemA (YlzA/DUF370 family)
MDNMNITSAQYVIGLMSGTTSGIKATIDNQQVSVPLDPATYAEIMRQVEAGTLTILAAE